MTKPKPKVMNPLCIPDCGEYPNADTNLSEELTERALIIHDRSFKGGSFSEFYDSCTQNFIALLTEALVKEAEALSNTNGRPLEKVLRAATKALAAMQTAINERNEELQ